MYDKLKNTFFNELNSDSLLLLSDNFYELIRSYIKNLDKSSIEYKRAMWYYLNLKTLRIYKINTMLNITLNNIEDIINNPKIKGITLEEKELLKQIINIDNINTTNIKNTKLPKPINSETDITMVRVNFNFPKFIYGNTEYSLEKDKNIKLPKNIVNILEKHGIVEKIK